jgi:glutaconyl-CoA decarboxylase
VLAALGLVIKFIHYLDPTKSKLEAEEDSAPAPTPAPVKPAASSQPVAEGIPPEIVAVIAAAVASYGYGADQIHSIRPLERTGWKTAVRTQITQRV